MKRVKSACICQTLHFLTKDDVGREQAAKLVKNEVETYKATLGHSGTKYKIIEETVQPDNSVIVKIIKQYNQTDVGTYLD